MSVGEARQADALWSRELLGKVGLGANSSLVWALQGRRIFSKIQCDQGRLWASEITDAWCPEHRAVMPGKVPQTPSSKSIPQTHSSFPFNPSPGCLPSLPLQTLPLRIHQGFSLLNMAVSRQGLHWPHPSSHQPPALWQVRSNSTGCEWVQGLRLWSSSLVRSSTGELGAERGPVCEMMRWA